MLRNIVHHTTTHHTTLSYATPHNIQNKVYIPTAIAIQNHSECSAFQFLIYKN